MKHSPKFEKVKSYYDNKIWKKKRMKKAVVDGWITPAEYEEIVDEPYEG